MPPLMVEAGHHRVDAQVFRQSLIAWGQEHIRSFPWRKTSDPYRILIAEIMLHRTQVSQVVPVYERFIVDFPSLQALSRASPAIIREMLHPLGLSWRIDLAVEMIIDLTTRFDNQIPEKRIDLLSLPGVSDYIASAVRCFAYGHQEPLIDTNTVRVIGRIFGLEIKPSSRRNRRYRELISSLVDPVRPDTYNYALLDLAHLICHKRKEPECDLCPLRNQCTYGLTRVQQQDS